MELVLISLFFLLILIIVIFYYSRRIKNSQKKIEELNKELKETQAQIYQIAQKQAQELFQQWTEKHLKELKIQIENALKKEYEVKLEEWKKNTEDKIRKDAISRSINVNLGKLGETFAPFLLAEKYNVDLRDFRYLGSPIDLIAFKGLSDDKKVEIIFIEVKSSKSNTLDKREKRVREAIENKRVKYELVSLKELLGDIKEKLRKMNEENEFEK